MWRFIDGGKTAGELYGRALVMIAAEQYASRLVVPSSQQTQPARWSSHKDLAARALRKLAGPHLPASLKQLERAVAKAHAERQNAATASRAQRDVASGDADDDVSDTLGGAEGVEEDLLDGRDAVEFT